MELHGIATSILSLPIPISVLTEGRSEAALLCREVNEEMAQLRNKHPDRFGFFAALPFLEDRQACIGEIRYAVDSLKADGVLLFTSYGEKYLGHPDFEYVWAELAVRTAVVFIHPTIEGAEKAIKDPFPVPRPLIDWTHETTRTALHLISTGTLRRNAGCKVILSHGGGTLPYVAGRAADLSIQMRLLDKPAGDFMEECRAFYFDIALAGYRGPLQLLLDFAQPEHVLYGTDYPFARDGVVAQQAVAINEILEGRSLTAQVGWEAALLLFPRLCRTGES